MRRKPPPRVSQRATRNWLEFASGGVVMEAPKAKPRTTPKRQPEAAIGEANREWASLKGGVLRKNPRGLAGYLPPGMPVGLAFPLILDEIGYLPVTVTTEMVGRRFAVLMVIEDKTKTGVVEEHQQEAIDVLREAGAIVGVSRSVEDSERLLAEWINR